MDNRPGASAVCSLPVPQRLAHAAFIITLPLCQLLKLNNKKHLKNVGPIRHCEPPHCHSPGVATVAHRLRIDVHDDNDNA